MKRPAPKRAFTLIELLVVIAIISLLASVVLAALNSSRKKGNDGRIQQEVLQIRTQLENDLVNRVYTDLTTTSVNLDTTSNANILTLAADIVAQNGGTPTFFNNGIQIFSSASSGSATDYAIYAKLNNGGYFCVDSTGHALRNTTASLIPFNGSGSNAANIPCQ